MIALLRKYKMTIRREFFVTGLMSAMLIAIIFIALLSLNMYNLNMENARQKLKSVNNQLATYTQGVLDSLLMSTSISAGYPDIARYQSGDRELKANILALFATTIKANPNIKNCYAGFENGELLIENYIAPVGYDPRLRPWYIAALSAYPELSVGAPYQDAQTTEWFISISRAIVDETGKLKGVVSVDFTLDYVKQLMAKERYYLSQSNYVLNSGGMIFAHSSRDYKYQNSETIVPGLKQLFTSDSGFIAYGFEGKPRMGYYQRMNGADWIIASAIDVSEVMNPIIIRISITVTVLMALAILLGLVQVKLYELSFVKPITSLRDRIAEITTGKKVEQSGYLYSNFELSEIANRIEAMAETSLRKKADQLELILASTSDGMLVLNLSGDVIHVNQKLMTMWGLTDISDMLKVSNGLLLEQILAHQDSTETTMNTLYLPNGIILEQNSSPLLDDGDLYGRLWSFRDVTEQIKAEENLKRLAITDELTGVWNRRQLMAQGKFEIELVKRTGLPLSMIFLDVDYFKQINDTFGHAVGDEALKYLTANITSHIRSTDMIARLGGEEFCILAVNTDQTAACLLAEKIRVFFENQTLVVKGRNVHFTISFGVASYTTGKGTIEDLLSDADKACYQAKALGRNRVVANKA